MNNDQFNKRGKIVGSAFRKNKQQTEQPTNIRLEQVLLLASQDKKFCESLLDHRQRALEQQGIVLAPADLTMLKSMPRAALSATISRLNPAKQKNKTFAKTVAAAVTGTVILVAGTGCDDGIDPEWEPYEDADTEETDTDIEEADGDGTESDSDADAEE